MALQVAVVNQLPDMVEPWTRAAEQGDVRGKGGGTGKSVGGTGTGARPMKPRARTGVQAERLGRERGRSNRVLERGTWSL